MANMASGVFRLKGPNLLEIGKRKGVNSINQLSLRSGITYATAHRYIQNPGEVEAMSLRNLYGILVDGLGLSAEEVMNMRIGDVFDAVPDKEGKAQ